MYLFVYGTLRRAFDNPMAQMLRANSDFEGLATVGGTVYQVNPRYPGLVAGAGKTPGELYRLKNNTVLEELDRYENCSPQDPEPHEYRRRNLWVRREDGSEVKAWVYVYQLDATGFEPVPR